MNKNAVILAQRLTHFRLSKQEHAMSPQGHVTRPKSEIILAKETVRTLACTIEFKQEELFICTFEWQQIFILFGKQ